MFPLGLDNRDQTETTTDVQQKTRSNTRYSDRQRMSCEWRECPSMLGQKSSRLTNQSWWRNSSLSSLCLRMKLLYSSYSLVIHRKSASSTRPRVTRLVSISYEYDTNDPRDHPSLRQWSTSMLLRIPHIMNIRTWSQIDGKIEPNSREMPVFTFTFR